MLKISLEGTQDIGNQLRNQLKLDIQSLAALTYDVAQTKTPVKTGRARKGWTKRTTDDNFVVENKVPYIERLEAGASRQAPKGIIGPTLTQVKGKFR